MSEIDNISNANANNYSYNDFLSAVGKKETPMLKSIFDRADRYDNEQKKTDGFYTSSEAAWKKLIDFAIRSLKDPTLPAQEYLNYKPVDTKKYERQPEKNLINKEVPFKSIEGLRNWLTKSGISYTDNNKELNFIYNDKNYTVSSKHEGITTIIKNSNGELLQKILFSEIRDNTNGTTITNYENGVTISEIKFNAKGKRESVSEYEYENGNIKQEVCMLEDSENRTQVVKYENGKEIRYQIFQDGNVSIWKPGWRPVDISQ